MKEGPITRANTNPPEKYLTEAKNSCAFSRNNTSSNAEGELYSSTPLSITQQALRSHSLISDILNSRRQKVIQHNLKCNYYNIPPSQKYFHHKVKTQEVIPRDYQFNSKNNKSIYTQITQPYLTKKVIHPRSSKGKSDLEINLGKDGVHPQRICISGLISYQFKSIRSKNHLALDPKGNQSQMVLEIEAAKKRSQAHILRQKKIRAKSQASIVDQALEKIIIKSVKADKTSDYLKKVFKEKNNQQIIYGKRSKQLQSLKRMKEQLNNIDEAYCMAEKIKKISQPQSSQLKKSTTKKLRLQKQTRAFQRRKNPCLRRKVCVSSLLSMGQ